MNIFKTKKFILTIILSVLIVTLSFGVLQVFSEQNVHYETYAFTKEGEDIDLDTVATVTLDSKKYWQKTADGVFEANVPYSKFIIWYSTNSATLTIDFNLEVESKLTLLVTHTSGSLSTSPSVPVASKSTIILGAGKQTITFTCSSTDAPQTGVAKVQILDITPNKEGIDEYITEGRGTPEDPYIINSKEALGSIKESAGGVFSLETDITFGKDETFTPICNDGSFAGVFYGNGHTIENLNISGGDNLGLFAATSGATIQDLTLKNINITGNSNIGSIVGRATNSTLIQNVNVENTNIYAKGASSGGFVGSSDSKTGVTVKSCNVSGTITNNEGIPQPNGSVILGNVGGFIGVGGTFENCISTAEVSGIVTVGGFVGGSGSDSEFKNCTMAGIVNLIGEHKNNYPYMGLINGYGAWNYFEATKTGQNLTVNYTSTQTVSKIEIFNSNITPTGINVAVPTADANGNYKFTQFVELNRTYVGSELSAGDLTSEVKYAGITGNYGGFTIRFTMEDGKYKYISTLDRKNARMLSNLNINLDELTSYTDNFKNLTILKDKGTYPVKYESNIPYGGTVQINTVEDFEHLSWVVNGCIPTTFVTGDTTYNYNGRSIATLSIDLQADIDLSNSTQFYGFGQSEMLPYRGSIYGNNHKIKVNMNYENAYLLGIINCSTDSSNYTTIENLTVEGSIHGKYRVGIVAMSDHHNRGTKLKMYNVINYANMTALSQVGSMLGNSQGGKSLLNSASSNSFENCINYGTITATAGDAGGLIGSLGRNSDEGSYSIKNCANYGTVSATGNAGGFIAWTRKDVTFTGENISAGPVNGTTAYNFFTAVGGMITTNATMKTVYTLDLVEPNLNLDIKSTNANGSISFANTNFVTDNNGLIKLEMLNVYTFSGVTLTANVVLENDLKILKTPQSVSLNNFTMLTSVLIPINIEMCDSETNLYNTTTSGANWVIKAKVIYNGNLLGKTTNIEVIDLVGLVGDKQLSSLLNTNQLIFTNVKFNHEKYNIPETEGFVVNLYRITKGVEDYVTHAHNLITKTSGTNQEFKTLGLNAKNSYNTLLNEISSYSAEDVTRFEDYIANNLNGTKNLKNIDASNSAMEIYYKGIVSEVKASTTETINYGNYSFNKTIKFIMLSGEVNNTIEYNFAKSDINSSLKAIAKTNGVSIKVGDVTTFTYNEDVEVTINKIDILNIALEETEYIYDNTDKTINATLTLIAGDSLNYKLSYNGADTARNVGTYEVTVSSISGDDAKFYNIPATYNKGKLTINAIKYVLNVEHEKKFTYSKQQTATTFTLTQNSNDYELQVNDYIVTYSGELLSKEKFTTTTTKPTDAGRYTATISFKNTNLEFADAEANSFNFEIEPKKLTKFACDTELEYNTTEHKFSFEFEELFNGDTLNVTYKIYNSSGEECVAKNAGDYTLTITSVGNYNYSIANLSKTIKIKKEILTITLENQTSTYGENVVLDASKKSISGTVYPNDDLGLKLSTNATNISHVADNYVINATTNNDNYDVTIVPAKYIITVRTATISFVQVLAYNYNSEDFYDSIKPSVSDEVLAKDINYFAFELVYNNQIVTEFKNAGTYVLKLVENEDTNSILSNYTIAKKSETYTITPKAITLKPAKIEKNYTQTISSEDFALTNIDLAGNDKLESVVEFNYIVCLKDSNEPLNYTNLNVGEYVIKLNVTNTDLDLYNNYEITLETNILKIHQRETSIDATYISQKVYDAEEIIFSAKLVDEYNNEIEGAVIECSILRNGKPAEEIKEVGKYTVEVKGTAGDNNKVANAEYEIEIVVNTITITLNNSTHIYNAQNYVPDYKLSYSNTKDDVTKLITSKVLDVNKVETQAKNKGSYYVEFSIEDSNYKIQKTLFNVTINPFAVQLTIKDQEYCYGEEFNIQESKYDLNKEIFPDDNLNLTFNIENYSAVAGEYFVNAEYNNDNYSVEIIKGKLHITKRQLNLQYSGESSLEFNKDGYTNLLKVNVLNALSNDVYSIYYLNSNNQQTNSIIDAGTYYLVVRLNDTANYKLNEKEDKTISKDIVISKKAMTLDIKISNKTYDGQLVDFAGVYENDTLMSSEIYLIQYFKNENVTTQPKEVGKYSIKIIEKFENNYTFLSNTKEFEIFARELTIKDIATTYEYSRTTIKPQLELQNIIEFDDVKLNLEYVESAGGFKEVGEYTILIKGLVGSKANNYMLNSSEKITFNIEQAQVAVNLKNNYFVFNNVQITKQNLGITFIGNIAILEEDYALSKLPINAGTYAIDFVNKNSNIKFNISSFDIEIAKAEITGIEFTNKIVNYNNQTHSLEVNTLTLSNGITLTVEYSANSFVDAGEYEVFATLTNSNYNTKVLSAKLIINAIELELELTENKEFTYNATKQGTEILGLTNLWYKDLITFNYVGKNYSSVEKPTNAGDYKLVILAKNENNIIIKNKENSFVIKTKGISIQSLQPQIHTYNTKIIAFILNYVGVVGADEVIINVLYNGETSAPKDAGTYNITFTAPSGKHANNYHLINADANTTLVINPYKITIAAHDKTMVYGDNELELTYESEALLGEDKLTGNIVREKGKNANSYIISQGSLTAGNNYNINFIKATYSITQRQLSFVDFQKEFTYNGKAQVPNIQFTNIANGDNNVVKVNTIGNTTNAGSYKIQFVLLNSNYILPETTNFNITILKQDISDNILGLITINKDYDGNSFEPLVAIDGDYDYELSYTLNGKESEQILNAGKYNVKVELVNPNLKGEKSFEFTVNKINYSNEVIKNLVVEIRSNGFDLIGLSNISVSTNGIDYVKTNNINQLNSKTEYNLYLQVEETENYNATRFNLGKYSTCASAEDLNEQITIITNNNVTAEDIQSIKQILIDCNNLGSYDRAILNEEAYNSLKNEYEAYFNNLDEDIECVKTSSSIVCLDEYNRIRQATSILTAFGTGILLLKKGRKNNEFKY